MGNVDHIMSKNRVCELAGVAIPLLQAPMTYIANATLAAAVSEAGGLGVIETASPQGRSDLLRVRELTDRPVAANLALRMLRNVDVDVVSLLEKADIRIVTTSAGDPSVFTERLHGAGITVLHVVGSLRAAQKAEDSGVDGLVVEGVEGGGFKNAAGASSMVLLPLVAERTSLPIVAAGGFCDSRSVAAALVLGAEGVQMGTRMLSSVESPVHTNFKDAIVAASEVDTVLVSPEGMPTMRVLRTAASEEAALTGGSSHRLADVKDLYFGGEMEASLANTGQVAGRITEIRPVASIIEEIWGGALGSLNEARERLGKTS
jgi:enoyl-[acyl-carrier protein] reductase II